MRPKGITAWLLGLELLRKRKGGGGIVDMKVLGMDVRVR
jgi:hypothetical protein